LQSRVGWWEGPPFGGGRSQFEYRGDTDAFNAALAKFGEIRATKLLLVVHGGAGTCQFLRSGDSDKSDVSVDWEFAVWDPESFRWLYDGDSDFNSKDPNFHQGLEPPRMDVYIAAGRIEWSKVKVPGTVTVEDERATTNGYKAEDGAVIRGELVDMVTGKPLAGGVVDLESYDGTNWRALASASTDARGKFEARRVPVESCRVVARLTGYASRELGYVDLYPDTLRTFNSRLSPSHELSGIAVDTAGKPLGNVRVVCTNEIGLDGFGYLMPEDVMAKTGEAGRFTLTGLPLGKCHLNVWAKGFYYLDPLSAVKVPGDRVRVEMIATGTIQRAVQ
jgi:hypothetical protein